MAQESARSPANPASPPVSQPTSDRLLCALSETFAWRTPAPLRTKQPTSPFHLESVELTPML